MPGRYLRCLTVKEARDILVCVPEEVLDRKSDVNPSFRKHQVFCMFWGAIQGEDDDKRLDRFTSGNILREFGQYEPEKEAA